MLFLVYELKLHYEFLILFYNKMLKFVSSTWMEYYFSTISHQISFILIFLTLLLFVNQVIYTSLSCVYKPLEGD